MAGYIRYPGGQNLKTIWKHFNSNNNPQSDYLHPGEWVDIYKSAWILFSRSYILFSVATSI